jgi:hypothetical protein
MPEKIIIADSSPLIGLARINQLELLPQLSNRIIIPPAVWDEVTVQGTGRCGRIDCSYQIAGQAET